MIVSGIYKIINKANGKYYVGSSGDIYKRWSQHQYFLNKNNHQNNYLQRSWNKYGENAFEMIVLEANIPCDKLLLTEQKHLNSVKKEKCYNLSLIAGKIEMTAETRDKIRQKLIGRKIPYRPCNPKDVKKRVESRKWYKHHSKETRKKISLARVGSHATEETKRKISISLKGNIPHNLDNTTFCFHNKITNEIFTGRKSELIKKYGLFKSPIYDMINGKNRRKSYKGWHIIRS